MADQIEIKDDEKEIKDIEIDLDKKDVKEPEKKEYNPDEIKKITEEAVKKATAPLYYEMRQLKQPKTEPVTPKAPEVPADEWDQKIQKDWKGTVRELARQEHQEIRKAEREAEKAENEKQKNTDLLESNKRKVLERHPELNDTDSEKASLYRQIVTENPAYVFNPFGPVLAMRDMEDRMREDGRMVDEPTKKIVEKEISRQTRANGTQAPSGTKSTGNKVILTSQEREYCDRMNMKYEEFAKMKQATSRNMRDGVTA